MVVQEDGDPTPVQSVGKASGKPKTGGVAQGESLKRGGETTPAMRKRHVSHKRWSEEKDDLLSGVIVHANVTACDQCGGALL